MASYKASLLACAFLFAVSRGVELKQVDEDRDTERLPFATEVEKRDGLIEVPELEPIGLRDEAKGDISVQDIVQTFDLPNIFSHIAEEEKVEEREYDISPIESWEVARDIEKRARPVVISDTDMADNQRDLGGCTSFESNPVHPLGAVSTVYKPWGPYKRKTCKIYMTWADGSSGVCSASLVGPFHIITAAHCTLDGCGNGFATRVLVKCGYGYYAGANDYAHLGTAYVASCTHYTNYVNGQSCVDGDSRGPFKWDIQLCKLDRSLSHSHGWYGYTTANYKNLNVRGYPGNWQLNAFIPQSTNKQLFRFTPSEDISSKQYKLPGAWIWGGESGCPYYAYKSSTNQRFVNAVHNGGPTGCTEYGRRIDGSFFNIIQQKRKSWTSDWNWCNVIEDYANIAGHHSAPWKALRVTGGSYSSYIKVTRGKKFHSKLPLINVGPKHTGNFYVYYYAKLGSGLTYLGRALTSVSGWATRMVYKSNLPTSSLKSFKTYTIIAKWYPTCKSSADPKTTTIGRVYIKPLILLPPPVITTTLNIP